MAGESEAERLGRVECVAVGIVMERRAGATAWQEHVWRPVAAIAGAPAVDGPWRILHRGEEWARFHAATLALELHRSDTEGYRLNLSQDPPRLWVVLRPAGEGEDEADGAGCPLRPCLVTASAHEAEAYQISGSDVVEPVPMPDAVAALVGAFVAQHHVDVPFEKRERKRQDLNALAPGQPRTGEPRHGRP